MIRHLRRYLLLYAKGMAMGAADVVPGVSGGTIAFISGIYDELLDSIAAVPAALRQMLRGDIRGAWLSANANFLLVLFAGVITSVLSLARLISWALVTHPVPVWSFFFGLILVSCWLVGREIKRWNPATLVALLAGGALAWWLTVAAPMQWSTGLPAIFLAGSIAICAMILPGISGSFLLVLMGLYAFVLESVKALDVAVLLVFAGGAVLGLLSFARVLSWLLHHLRHVTLAFLTGLMLGSLNKVWPWKQTLSWRTDSHGVQQPVQQTNLLPEQFAQLTGEDSRLMLAILMAMTGIILVAVLEWLGSRSRQEQK